MSSLAGHWILCTSTSENHTNCHVAKYHTRHLALVHECCHALHRQQSVEHHSTSTIPEVHHTEQRKNWLSKKRQEKRPMQKGCNICQNSNENMKQSIIRKRSELQKYCLEQYGEKKQHQQSESESLAKRWWTTNNPFRLLTVLECRCSTNTAGQCVGMQNWQVSITFKVCLLQHCYQEGKYSFCLISIDPQLCSIYKPRRKQTVVTLRKSCKM